MTDDADRTYGRMSRMRFPHHDRGHTPPWSHSYEETHAGPKMLEFDVDRATHRALGEVTTGITHDFEPIPPEETR